MLLEVDNWIRLGRSVITGGTPDRSPLAIAAGKGFYSLVELLLTQAPSQDILDAAMAKAATGDAVETLRLLAKSGATLKVVSADSVVGNASPDAIEFLVRGGMDVSHEDALGRALYKEQSAAVAYFRKHHRRHAVVRDQGAKALIRAVKQDEEHRSLRLKRAGADPRRRVMPLYPQEHGCRYGATALEEAAACASFKALLNMGPRKSDDLAALVDDCCRDFDIAKIMMLIRRGAVVNDREDGGSSLLEKCLTSLSMGEYYQFPRFYTLADRAWELMIKLVTELGAKWNPSPESLRTVRIWLKYGDPKRMCPLAVLLLDHDVTPHPLIRKLFDTPGFQKKLGQYWPAVQKVLSQKMAL